MFQDMILRRDYWLPVQTTWYASRQVCHQNDIETGSLDLVAKVLLKQSLLLEIVD